MPRTTIDLSTDNYNRLRRFCQRRHTTLRKAVNQLIHRALDQPIERERSERPRLPAFRVGVRLDPADRETLFDKMNEDT